MIITPWHKVSDYVFRGVRVRNVYELADAGNGARPHGGPAAIGDLTCLQKCLQSSMFWRRARGAHSWGAALHCTVGVCREHSHPDSFGTFLFACRMLFCFCLFSCCVVSERELAAAHAIRLICLCLDVPLELHVCRLAARPSPQW